jgi:DNA-directed RNA polymerase sigma subunit (sigma70/sigma32)
MKTESKLGAVMTYREIGKELGVSEQRAKQIFNNAVRKLRKNFPVTLELMMEMCDDKESMRRES